MLRIEVNLFSQLAKCQSYSHQKELECLNNGPGTFLSRNSHQIDAARHLGHILRLTAIGKGPNAGEIKLLKQQNKECSYDI